MVKMDLGSDTIVQNIKISWNIFIKKAFLSHTHTKIKFKKNQLIWNVLCLMTQDTLLRSSGPCQSVRET